MFAVMSTLHLKDNGDLHVLELASILNKCMQCCLFLKKPALRCVFCVGFPSALSHTRKITSEAYVMSSHRCSLFKILQIESGIFVICNQTARSAEAIILFK